MIMGMNNRILLLHKPTGLTSFSVLGPVKRVFGKRVGHAGTLDKFAEGLLIVLLGKFTKLNPLFSTMDKRYRAEFHFGRETDTLDPEGAVIKETDVPSSERIREVLGKFIGEIDQRPPVYSAVHVNGKRAYQEARKGNSVDIPSRKITVFRLELIAWNEPFLTLDITCSKGTYIRSLARDIGEACGSSAYVSKLVRSEIGPYRLDEAIEPEQLETAQLPDPRELFKRIEGVHELSVDHEELKRIENGILPRKSIAFSGSPDKDHFGLLIDEKQVIRSVVKLRREGRQLITDSFVFSK